MANAQRDGNYVPTVIGVSSVDLITPTLVAVNPATGAVLIDLAGGGSGTVTSVSVVSANGFAGTVATATTTPAITLTTTVTGILKGNGTAISAATAGTDYTALAFKTIAVAGQSDIVADSAADTLTIVAGTGVTLTTDAATDTLTIALTTDPAGYANTALSNLASVAINAALVLNVSDAFALGSATKQWSDLFLAEGGVINWDAGDVTITQTNNVLAIAGITDVTVAGNITPLANDGGQLGAALTSWSDLFLAEGGVINWDNGDATITQTSNVIAIAGITDLTVSGNVTPATNDVGQLGSASLQWGDLFLAEGGVINWDNGDATITQTGNVIAVAGITDLTVSGNVTPAANDGGQLGSATVSWADLFLASGAVINIANGNWVATHTSGILTVTTGDLRVTSANVGTNADSVPTLSSTSTLTNKTLTAPTIGGAALLSENAAIQLDSALSADGKYTGIIRAGTAGTTLAFGDLVYLAAADSRWELTDADAASTSGDVIIAMCVLAAAADGDPTTLLLYGNIRADTAFPALTIGAQAYVSTTAGDIQTAQPNGTDDVIRVVGFALTADELMFNPSPDYITHV